jgi:hypothetical protein
MGFQAGGVPRASRPGSLSFARGLSASGQEMRSGRRRWCTSRSGAESGAVSRGSESRSGSPSHSGKEQPPPNSATQSRLRRLGQSAAPAPSNPPDPESPPDGRRRFCSHRCLAASAAVDRAGADRVLAERDRSRSSIRRRAWLRRTPRHVRGSESPGRATKGWDNGKPASGSATTKAGAGMRRIPVETGGRSHRPLGRRFAHPAASSARPAPVDPPMPSQSPRRASTPPGVAHQPRYATRRQRAPEPGRRQT